MKKIIVLLALVAMVGLAHGELAEIIDNGDFELGSPGWLPGSVPTGWGGAWNGNGYFNADVPPSIGTQSIKMWWDDTGIWQSFLATEGQTFDFSVQVQDWSGDTADPGEETWDGVLAACFWTETGGLLLRQEFVLDSATMIDDIWYTIYGTATAPAGTYWGQIQLYLAGWTNAVPMNGSVYFDNASVFPAGRPLAPTPRNEAVVAAGTTTTLSWTNPPSPTGEPLSIAVKFDQETGGVLDPNFVPDTPIAVGTDIETLDLTGLVDLPLAENQLYSWQVIVTDPNNGGPLVTEGPIWTFETGDAPPVVNAGPDQHEGLDPTLATVDLNGSITDDGKSLMTTLWTVNPITNVTIAAAGDQVTTATVSATGTYTFTLTATDANGPIADSMTAIVYGDPCAAVLADPAVAPFLGDITGPAGLPDCKVTLSDFAAIAADWLDCLDDRLGCTP